MLDIELSGPVSLRADLIFVVAARIYTEGVCAGVYAGLPAAKVAEKCVGWALELAGEVDRQVAGLRRAQKGEK